jgi:hypothetical protein
VTAGEQLTGARGSKSGGAGSGGHKATRALLRRCHRIDSPQSCQCILLSQPAAPVSSPAAWRMPRPWPCQRGILIAVSSRARCCLLPGSPPTCPRVQEDRARR